MCTGIRIKSAEGQVFFGRTMDLPLDIFEDSPQNPIPSGIIKIPRGTRIKSQLKDWTAKYSIMGLGALDSFDLYDGVNECGLAGNNQVFDEALRGELDTIKEQGLTPFIGEEFVTYILSKFSSVKEIRAAYKNYALVNMPFELCGQEVMYPLHYSFLDPSGDMIVLEPTKGGRLRLFTGLGVMTNSPSYRQHARIIKDLTSSSPFDNGVQKFNHRGLFVEKKEGAEDACQDDSRASIERFKRAYQLVNSLDDFKAKDGPWHISRLLQFLKLPVNLEKEEGVFKEANTVYWVSYDLTKKALYLKTNKKSALKKRQLDPYQKEISYESCLEEQD
ncbi:linear amide C-N hydrolase [Streptococcaceae bacterium ESL0687]|nr:linear amide C-N hydrolase [Streptococcaceae bacterium ESL0687]